MHVCGMNNGDRDTTECVQTNGMLEAALSFI